MPKAWTESLIISRIRATLRRLSMQMPAAREAKLKARRAYSGPNPRQRFEYKCAHCGDWFPEKGVQVDHTVLRYDGRPFSPQDVIAELEEVL